MSEGSKLALFAVALTVLFIAALVNAALHTRNSSPSPSRDDFTTPSLDCKVPYPDNIKDTVPAGCPNVIQTSLKLISMVNDSIDITTNNLFTYIIQDGENNLSADVRLADWWCAMKKYLVKSNRLEEKELRFGQAKQGSLTTESMIQGCVKNIGESCGDLAPPKDQLLSFPEVYWYIDDINLATEDIRPGQTCDASKCGKGPGGQITGNCKDGVLCDCVRGWGGENCLTPGGGCNGCNHYNLGVYRSQGLDNSSKNMVASGPYNAPSDCNAESCNTKDVITMGKPGAFGVCTDAVKKGTCSTQDCCLYPSCAMCANTEISYIKYRDSPEEMAEFMYQRAIWQNLIKDPKGLGWTLPDGTPQAFPMFSNEVAHDWNFPDIDGIIVGTTQKIDKGTGTLCPNGKCLCTGMNNGVPICGTFDGFGIWTWTNFCKFVEAFALKTRIYEFGLYSGQFLYPHWINADQYEWTVNKENGGIKLHLYQGGWGSIDDVDVARKNIKGIWTDCATFANNQKLYAVHMAIDHTKNAMTKDFVLELANMIKKPTKLGAVISATPKYGFDLTGVEQQFGGYMFSGNTCESAKWY